MVNCVECGVAFPQSAGRGRPRIRCPQCSPTTAGQTTVSERSAVCANPACGKAFTATHASTKYCCVKCRCAQCNRIGQTRKRDRTDRPCKQCGSLFAPAYGDRRRVFCSNACIMAAHNERTSGRSHVRRARRFGCVIEEVDVFAVFERDGWTCYLCGDDTPRALRGTTEPRAPELEHVIPLAELGPHTYANTRCACRSCNRAKGARLEFNEKSSHPV